MKIIANKILVKDPTEDKKEISSKGGILLQEKIADRHAPLEVEVALIGEGVTEVSVGDTIVIPAHTGYSFSREGVSYRLVEEADILCII